MRRNTSSPGTSRAREPGASSVTSISERAVDSQAWLRSLPRLRKPSTARAGRAGATAAAAAAGSALVSPTAAAATGAGAGAPGLSR